MPDTPKPNGPPVLDDGSVGTSAELPRWVTPAIVLVVAGGVLFYFWLVFTRWCAADKWGDFGSAVGPFVGLLNAGALFAALYSVRLQRRELELQRQELRETREEMVEQRKQFEKTAAAQEELARSTRNMADAQRDGNRLTERTARQAEVAQRFANVAVLQSAVANLQVAIQQVPPGHAGFVKNLNEEITILGRSLHRAVARLKELGIDFSNA